MPEFTISVERLDDLPLLLGFIEKMGIQSTIDTVIKPHGNWRGLSMGWVVSIWLSHIISVYNHRMDRVQEWAATHQVSLRQLTGQNVTELDFTDDRLAICLRELHEPGQWRRIEPLSDTPCPMARVNQGLLEQYLRQWQADDHTAMPVFLPDDEPETGQEPDLSPGHR
ncbi:MAG: DUF4277 domain-containing protein [Chloroflexi bacterium]|nr:DUF4277 domain-containing protein [Chloroflexota bacterium]